jgi:hypothetical protein
VAKKVFRERKTVRGLFRPYEKKVVDQRDYLKKVLASLVKPAKSIPPLILFRGRCLGLGRAYYKLNPGFFIRNRELHFFDDLWFSKECREGTHSGARAKFYMEALVDRQPCGLTLWKDWSQFSIFFNAVGRAAQSSEFAGKAGRDDYERYVPKFLKNLWKMMREGIFPDSVCRKIVERGMTGLRSSNMDRLRPLVRVADWRLFGNLGGKEIVGKTGTLDFLISHSGLLKELSNLTGEIPFYVFIVGEARDVEEIKKEQKKLGKLLTIMSESFIMAILDCFDLREISGAWREATKNDS